MPRRIPDALAATARPYLREVADLCTKAKTSPSDYALLLGKYATENTFLFPRSSASALVARARTPAGRIKCERLLAAKCDPHDLLVVVTAGDHFEGYFMRVPTVVPKEAAPLTEVPPCSCGCGKLAEMTLGDELFYTRACFQRTVDELREMGVPIEQSKNGVRLAGKVSYLLGGPGPGAEG